MERYQSEGQWGRRHFAGYVFNVPFPEFDAGNALHCELAQAAKTAEEIADAVQLKEDEHFTRARTRVRSALAGHGIAAQLERLVGKIFRGG